MPEFVQIEKSELEEIFSRMSYLKKVFITFFERVRNKSLMIGLRCRNSVSCYISPSPKRAHSKRADV